MTFIRIPKGTYVINDIILLYIFIIAKPNEWIEILVYLFLVLQCKHQKPCRHMPTAEKCTQFFSVFCTTD